MPPASGVKPLTPAQKRAKAAQAMAARRAAQKAEAAKREADSSSSSGSQQSSAASAASAAAAEDERMSEASDDEPSPSKKRGRSTPTLTPPRKKQRTLADSTVPASAARSPSPAASRKSPARATPSAAAKQLRTPTKTPAAAAANRTLSPASLTAKRVAAAQKKLSSYCYSPSSSTAAAAASAKKSIAAPSSPSPSPEPPLHSPRRKSAEEIARSNAKKAATLSAKAQAKINMVRKRAATMAAKAAAAAAAAGSHSGAAIASPTVPSVGVDGAIHVPPFRVINIAKVAAVISRFADAAGGKEHQPPIEDMSEKAFIKRHRKLEKDEAQIREEERRDSIVRWAICDAPGCKKWRILAKHSSIPTDSSIHWYCGGVTSRGGGKPIPKNCAVRDDWILKCVGERLAKELEAAGITTVAQLESKEKGQPPAHYATYCARMRALGVYYDTPTQTICKY